MSANEERRTGAPARAEIEAFLRAAVAELIDDSPEAIDVHKRFSQFGLDSASALIVTDMLAEWLGVELDATLLYEHETIDALSRFLCAQLPDDATHAVPNSREDGDGER